MEKTNTGKPRPQRGALLTLHSRAWPDCRSTIWTSGKAWFCRTEHKAWPDLATVQSFTTREAAFEHARVVLGGIVGELTEARAKELAKHDRHYVARQNGSGEWIVWDCVSDHRVEFQEKSNG